MQSLRYDANDGFSIDGHMPFGVTDYPNERSMPSIFEQYLLIGIIIAIIIIALIVALVSVRKKK